MKKNKQLLIISLVAIVMLVFGGLIAESSCYWVDSGNTAYKKCPYNTFGSILMVLGGIIIFLSIIAWIIKFVKHFSKEDK